MVTQALPPRALHNSPPCTARFLLQILAVVPSTTRTKGDAARPTIVTLITRNVAVQDPLSRIVVAFGNQGYEVAIPVAVPTTATGRAALRNADGSMNLTFPLPTIGAGKRIGVAIGAQSILAASSGVVGVGSGVFSQVTNASMFSYLDPVIEDVVVTQVRFNRPGANNGTSMSNTTSSNAMSGIAPAAAVCPFPPGDPVWQCTDPELVLLTINGDNFGAAPGTAAALADRVLRRLELLRFTDPISGAELWSETSHFLATWDHTKIIVITKITASTVRVSLTSTGACAEARGTMRCSCGSSGAV